mgnify:CR=1 FL=1
MTNILLQFTNLITNLTTTQMLLLTFLSMMILFWATYLFTGSLLIASLPPEMINIWNLTIYLTPWLGLEQKLFMPPWISLVLFVVQIPIVVTWQIFSLGKR